MLRGISTHIFLQHRLHTGHLDAMLAAGAETIELFAARHHFDFADRGEVREIASWFRANPCRATLHQPIFENTGSPWSRHVPATINLISPDKRQRIEAMEEIKRSLDVAEQIAIDSIVLHLGSKDDAWEERTLDLSLTALEHIKAFASPLGVRVLVETLPNRVSYPENLLEILRIGHLDTVGVCLDTGHMNLPDMPGVPAAIEVLGWRIAEVHLHDNDGERDEHSWPGDGTIDWTAALKAMGALEGNVKRVLEIRYEPETTIKALPDRAEQAFRLLETIV